MNDGKDWFQVEKNGSGTLPWGEVKKRLKGKTEKELIKLIGECYKVGPDIQIKLSLAVSEGRSENVRIISDLKSRLHKAFWAYEKNGCPKNPELKEANKMISLARKSTDDPVVLLDIMLDHFKHGVEFTLEHGDMWDAYYYSIESMFKKTCEFMVVHRSHIDLDNALARIEKHIKQTEIMGWGFHDNLSYFREELDNKLSYSGGKL